MRILITGDKGKLGGMIRRRLQDAGHSTKGLDANGDPDGDIIFLNDKAVRKFEGIDAVVHCAAIPHPSKSMGFEPYFMTNVVGTANVISEAVKHGVKKFIYLSSTGFYGCDMEGVFNVTLPVTEDHPPVVFDNFKGKLDAYNQSKVMAEQILAWYGSNEKIEVTVFRCAPANTKKEQFTNGTWRQQYPWVPGCLFANCDPETIPEAVLLAVERQEAPFYDVFNLADKYTHEAIKEIDIQEWVSEREKKAITNMPDYTGQSLISSEKAEDELGWKPNEGND